MTPGNRGEVASWSAKCNVTAHGASGIGFLNVGAINVFSAEGPIKTTGNGSVGVRLSRELPKLTIGGRLSTAGGTGESLLKGMPQSHSAIGLSVKPSGRIGELDDWWPRSAQ